MNKAPISVYAICQEPIITAEVLDQSNAEKLEHNKSCKSPDLTHSQNLINYS